MLVEKNSALEVSATHRKRAYHSPEFATVGTISDVIEHTAGVGTDVNPPSAQSSLS